MSTQSQSHSAHLQPFYYPTTADLAPADIHSYEEDLPFLADLFEEIDHDVSWH